MSGWRAGPVILCVLVLAAGCSTATGVWSSADPAPTLTPAPVPETPAVSAADVPGVSPDGSVDADLLADVHARATDNRTYTWVFRLTRTGPESDTRRINATRRVEVGPDATLITDGQFPEFPSNQTVYLTDREGYRQLRGIETAMILNETRGDRRYVFAESLLRFNLREDGYRVETVERDGRRSLRLYHPPGVSASDNGTGTYTATARVTRTGFVRSFSVTFTNLRGDRVSLEFTYTDVDETTVATPAWVSRLRATATADPSATPANRSTVRSR